MIIDGKLVAKEIKNKVKEEVNLIISETGKAPTLAVVIVGNDPASEIYVRNKEKACAYSNIQSIKIEMSEETTQEELNNKIDELACDNKINGILVQFPLPKHLNQDEVISHIPYYKDVDGLTKENVAKLVLNEEGIFPCTPTGVIDLLKYYNIEVSGKNVVILGRSMLVGKPLSFALSNLNATVTLCHSKTTNLDFYTKNADIIVAAIGKPKFLKKEQVSSKVVIIDVGINRMEDGICGDADYDNLVDYVSYITPVPGGCGPMTVAELLTNTLKCYKIQNKQ